MRRVPKVAGLFAVAALSVACGSVSGSASSVGGEIAMPIELRPVLQEWMCAQQPVETATSTPPGAVEAQDRAGEECFVLLEPFLELHEVEELRAHEAQEQQGWMIALELGADDGVTFGDWTAEHQGERVAITMDGEVLAAPQIVEPIRGGNIEIGPYEEDEAKEIVEAAGG